MSASVLWSARAAADLTEIYFSIAEDKPQAADRLITALRERAESLAQLPRLGAPRLDMRPGLRALVHDKYLIVYKLDPDHDAESVEVIQIVRILHGRRDVNRLHRVK